MAEEEDAYSKGGREVLVVLPYQITEITGEESRAERQGGVWCMLP